MRGVDVMRMTVHSIDSREVLQCDQSKMIHHVENITLTMLLHNKIEYTCLKLSASDEAQISAKFTANIPRSLCSVEVSLPMKYGINANGHVILLVSEESHTRVRGMVEICYHQHDGAHCSCNDPEVIPP